NALYCSNRAKSRSRASSSARSSSSSTSPRGSSRAALRSRRVAATSRNELVCSRSQTGPPALTYTMNSSVTWESATSVTSSLCLAINESRRSKGPSKLSRLTAKPAEAESVSTSSVIDRSFFAQSADQCTVLAMLREVGQHHGDRLTDDAAAVDGQSVLAAQRQTCVLKVEQLVRGDVDRHLLVVPHPPTGPGDGILLGCGPPRGACTRRGGAGRRRGLLGVGDGAYGLAPGRVTRGPEEVVRCR